MRTSFKYLFILICILNIYQFHRKTNSNSQTGRVQSKLFAPGYPFLWFLTPSCHFLFSFSLVNPQPSTPTQSNWKVSTMNHGLSFLSIQGGSPHNGNVPWQNHDTVSNYCKHNTTTGLWSSVLSIFQFGQSPVISQHFFSPLSQDWV